MNERHWWCKSFISFGNSHRKHFSQIVVSKFTIDELNKQKINELEVRKGTSPDANDISKIEANIKAYREIIKKYDEEIQKLKEEKAKLEEKKNEKITGGKTPIEEDDNIKLDDFNI